MKRAILIQPNGQVTEQTVPEKSEAEYALYSKFVEGYVERVQLPCGFLIVNEEGLIRGMQPNRVASAIVNAHYKQPKMMAFYDEFHIVGPAVLLLHHRPAKQSALLTVINEVLKQANLPTLA